MTSHYRLNEPDVSAEVFDDEVLAINLKNGHYHSIRETGVFVWQSLIRGCSVDDVAIELARAFPGEAEDAAGDARVFAAELEASGLIVPVVASIPTPMIPAALGVPASPYAKPVLENYTDMQELLLIDPIHEVDVYSGWPNKPSALDAA